MIPIKQRDDFSDYLRSKCRVTRSTSHDVARAPGRHWLVVEIGSGWLRAYRMSDDPEKRRKDKNTVLQYLRGSGPALRPLSYFMIRWKVDPQPGPNSWQRRRYDPYLRRYVDTK